MKNAILFLLYFTTGLLSVSCQSNAKNKEAEAKAQKEITPVQVPLENGLAKAYFASGCFWCVEAIYESVKGVAEVYSGYSGGTTENPTYESSNTGLTGHAEAVEVIYDPSQISFKDLVEVYFSSQNVTQINGQGPDYGSQYRSIVFYQNNKEKEIIENKINTLEKEIGKGKVAAQVLPFQKFWMGEAYHQDFEKNHPNHPYIQNVSIPRLKKFQQKHPELLKNKARH